VDVLECFGLSPQRKSLPSVYVEVKTLPSDFVATTFRTKRKGKTLDPIFNEKFELAISKDKCAFRTLALSVMYASGRFGKDKVMGEVLFLVTFRLFVSTRSVVVGIDFFGRCTSFNSGGHTDAPPVPSFVHSL